MALIHKWKLIRQLWELTSPPTNMLRILLFSSVSQPARATLTFRLETLFQTVKYERRTKSITIGNCCPYLLNNNDDYYRFNWQIQCRRHADLVRRHWRRCRHSAQEEKGQEEKRKGVRDWTNNIYDIFGDGPLYNVVIDRNDYHGS